MAVACAPIALRALPPSCAGEDSLFVHQLHDHHGAAIEDELHADHGGEECHHLAQNLLTEWPSLLTMVGARSNTMSAARMFNPIAPINAA